LPCGADRPARQTVAVDGKRGNGIKALSSGGIERSVNGSLQHSARKRFDPVNGPNVAHATQRHNEDFAAHRRLKPVGKIWFLGRDQEMINGRLRR